MGPAARFGTDVESLAYVNRLTTKDRLRPGQRLRILTGRGIVHLVSRGDTVDRVAREHRVDPGRILEANDVDPGKLAVGGELIIPGAGPPEEPSATGASNRSQSTGGLRWPLRGKITSPFGWRIHPVYRVRSFHEGIDISAPRGTPIRAARDGRVVFAGWDNGNGLTLILDHGGGLQTRYSHNSRNLVAPGDVVRQGQVIAEVGTVGDRHRSPSRFWSNSRWYTP